MSNLANRNKITVGGGLHSRIAAKELQDTLIPKADSTKMPNRITIIADFSGSMDSGIYDHNRILSNSNSNKSKLECLKEAVQDFALRSDDQTTAIAVQSFPEGFCIDLTVDKQEVYLKMTQIHTLGDTPIGQGMISALRQKPSRCMIISDGEATDGNAAFDQAKSYKEKELVCDTVHIGESTSGEATLKKIAEITGGMYLKFRDAQTFAESFHFLLPEQREAIAGMLPYERAKLLGADESK